MPRLKLAAVDEDRSLTLNRFLRAGSPPNDSEDEDENTQNGELDWSGQLSRIRTLLLSASTRRRCETLERIKGIDFADNKIRSDLLAALTLTVPRYIDQQSRQAVLDVLQRLVQHEDTRKSAAAWIVSQQSNSAVANSTRYSLLSWAVLLLEACPTTETPVWIALAQTFGDTYAQLVQSEINPGLRKSTVGMTRRTLRKFPDRLPQWIDALSASPNPQRACILLGVVIGVAIRLKGQFLPGGKRENQGFGMVQSRYSTILDFYVAHLINSKASPNPTIVSAMAEFVEQFLSAEDLQGKIMPAVEKALLRNPDAVLPTLINLFSSTRHTEEVSQLFGDKLHNTVIMLAKSTNINVRQLSIEWFQILFNKSSPEVQSIALEVVCTILSSGKAGSNEHKAALLRILGNCRLDASASARVVKAIQPVLAKDSNELVLDALSNVLAVHLQPLCSTPQINEFAPALVKGMQDPKATIRKAVCLGVGRALWRAAVDEKQSLDSNFCRSLAPALSTNLKNASTTPLTNPAGPLEGYIAIAVVHACFGDAEAAEFSKSNDTMQHLLDVGVKPSFLVYDKVYARNTTVEEEGWLVAAIHATVSRDLASSQESDRGEQPIAALMHVALSGKSRPSIQSALKALQETMLARHHQLDNIAVKAILPKAQDSCRIRPAEDQKDDSLRINTRLRDIVKSATVQPVDQILDEQHQSLARYACLCHHRCFLQNADSFWIQILLLRGLNPSAVVEGCLSILVDQSLRALELPELEDTAIRTISTLAFILPNAVIPSFIHHVERLSAVDDLQRLSPTEIGILHTPIGEMYEDVLAEKSKTASDVPAKGKDKALQQWEDEVRKSAAKKATANGVKVLSKSDQALVKQRLDQEDAIRQRVSGFVATTRQALLILAALASSQSIDTALYLADLYAQVERLLDLPGTILVATELRQALTAIINATFHDAADLRAPLLTALLASSQSSALPQGSSDEQIDDLITRLLYRLRFLSESQPLPAASFALILPLLRNIITSAGPGAKSEKRLERVTLAVDVISFHTSAAADLTYPRLGMIQVLLKCLAEYPHVTKSATTALVALGEALSSNGSIEEYSALLTGAMVDQAHIRLAALQALQTADLTDMHFSVALFLLCHDQDERNANVAETVWLENAFQIPADFTDAVLPFADHSTAFARRACAFCVAAGVDAQPEQRKPVLNRLFDLYRERNRELVPQLDNFGLVIDATLDREDLWPSRAAVANALLQLVPTCDEQDVLDIFQLLVQEEALADRSATVRSAMLEVANAIVDVHGDAMLSDLRNIVEPCFENSAQNSDYLTEAAVIIVGKLASHMSPDDPRVSDVVERLFKALSTPSETVQIAVSECLSPLVQAQPDLATILIPRLLKNSVRSAKYAERRGSAYGIAGVVKGYGVKALREFSILSSLRESIDDKKDINRRQGALFVVETLTTTLGRIFEPNLTQILPILLAALGDTSTDVRDAATDAAKIMMQQLSGHAVKVILPILMSSLEDKQWRSKKGAIDMMGSMAYLAPRQLSQSLSEIIPQLTLVLTDTHVQVRSSGNASLKRFGEVVTNPEIQSMQSILLDALVDPSKKTPKALDKLISTTFAHFLDASSLALVVPILDRGLRERSSDQKRKAAQIVGNLASLTDGKDFQAYLTQLTPLIRSVLIDPVPEARATAAKSLGSMVERLGEDAFPGLIPTLLDVLQSSATGVDQQGAAQGLAEILGGLGVDRLDDFFPDIITQTTSAKAYVREGYMSLVVFLPSVFGDRFAPYLARIIQPVLRGLADDSDYVRDASMRAGRMIVTSHSQRAVDLLLPELESGLFDNSWRIRQSSMQLVGELLFKLVGLTTKADQVDDEEKEEEAEERTTAEASRKVLLEVLGKEKRDRILAAVYIVRQDPSGLVRQLSLHVWKALVHNTPKTVREILSSLIFLIVRTFSTGANEQRETAARTLGDLCKKLGESILNEMLPILEKSASGDVRTRQGTCFAYAEILENCSEDQLEGHESQIISAIRGALVDPDANVRAAAAKAFDAVQEHLGSQAVDQTVPTLLAALNDDGDAADAALAALKEILRVRASTILPTLIPTLTTVPVSTANAKALSSLVAVAGPALSKKAVNILTALDKSRSIATDEENIKALDTAMRSLFASMEDAAGLASLLMHILGQLKDPAPSKRIDACGLLSMFCQETTADHTDYDVDFVRQIVSLLDDRAEGVPQAASLAMAALLKTIDKDDMEGLSTSLRRSIENIGSHGQTVEGFCIDGGLKPILRVFSRLSKHGVVLKMSAILVQGLLTGTAEQREASAYGLGDVVAKTSPEAVKPYVAQIAGPLIRIVGERVPPHVRTAILSALTVILERIPLLVRPFYPQIQRTFAKNLGDTSSLAVRSRAATGLGVLMTHQPRIDPLITELITNMTSSEDSEARESYASALAKVLISGGRNITPPIKESVANLLQEAHSQRPTKESWCNALAKVLAALAVCDEKLASPLVEQYIFNTSPSTTLSSISLRTMIENSGTALLHIASPNDVVTRVLADASKPDEPAISRPAKESRELLKTSEPFVDIDEIQSKL